MSVKASIACVSVCEREGERESERERRQTKYLLVTQSLFTHYVSHSAYFCSLASSMSESQKATFQFFMKAI